MINEEKWKILRFDNQALYLEWHRQLRSFPAKYPDCYPNDFAKEVATLSDDEIDDAAQQQGWESPMAVNYLELVYLREPPRLMCRLVGGHLFDRIWDMIQFHAMFDKHENTLWEPQGNELEELFAFMREHDIPAREPEDFQLLLRLGDAGVRIIE